jgi:cytochrome b subunit of formate dehydrogenase
MSLCVECHEQHDADTPAGHASGSFFSDYLESAHGRAFSESGLTSAAMCTDCHSAHEVRTADDPLSKIYRDNVPATCGACHEGITKTFDGSVHGQHLLDGDAEAPVCTDCHTAHAITRAETPKFMLAVVNECGSCHDDQEQAATPTGTYYRTYRASYHGQVNRLGSTLTARCSDCHGAHDILPLDDPDSRVFGANLIETCGQVGCHPGANANFVRFDPHADYRDSERSPVLFGVWIYFIVLMSSVFAFFGMHTLLWFVRSVIERVRSGPPEPHTGHERQIRRFTKLNRINHGLVVITFLGLSATGIPLAFAGEEWAPRLAWIFGGVEMAGIWHRCFGFLLIINVLLHLVGIAHSFLARKNAARRWAFGPSSLVPCRRDVTDCLAMFRWFFKGGKAPGFDRWTYFEKFDYWCEIGGTGIIGGSGLLLWFPQLASTVLPGWSFNVAMVVHGYEALLAMGFIFTIHFFNANLRIGKFPVDKVIFSGRMPEAELAEERPSEYERLLKSGELDELTAPAWPAWKSRMFTVLGISAMLFATGLLTLIILAGIRTQ